MAWEIDIWGRIRRATEASLADLYATEDVRRGVVLSLVTTSRRPTSSCASSISSWRSRCARATRFRRRSISSSAATGAASATSWRRRARRPRLASTAATIPDVERQIVAKENQLSILLGRPPGPIARGDALSEQQPATCGAGGPACRTARAPSRRPAGRAEHRRGQRTGGRRHRRLPAAHRAHHVVRRAEQRARERREERRAPSGRSVPRSAARSSRAAACTTPTRATSPPGRKRGSPTSRPC